MSGAGPGHVDTAVSVMLALTSCAAFVSTRYAGLREALHESVLGLSASSLPAVSPTFSDTASASPGWLMLHSASRGSRDGVATGATFTSRSWASRSTRVAPTQPSPATRKIVQGWLAPEAGASSGAGETARSSLRTLPPDAHERLRSSLTMSSSSRAAARNRGRQLPLPGTAVSSQPASASRAQQRTSTSRVQWSSSVPAQA